MGIGLSGEATAKKDDVIFNFSKELYCAVLGLTYQFDIVEGLIFYRMTPKSPKNYFIADFYVTGQGKVGETIKHNAFKDIVAKEFLKRNKEYKSFIFQAHPSSVAEHYGETYDNFLDSLKVGLVITPSYLILDYGFDYSITDWNFQGRSWNSCKDWVSLALNNLETLLKKK